MKGKMSISVIENVESKTSDEKHSLTKFQKIIYTIIHLYIHLTFGLTLSSMAPAFVDFEQILHTEMRWIGLFPTFQAVGTLVGSTFTLLYKWINRQIALCTLVIGMSMGTIFMPWATQLWHLYVCIFVYGLGVGAWNGANNVILIEMWQQRSPSVLQFSQFIYGIGTILGPLLSSGYVIGEMICPGVYPNQCFGNNTAEHHTYHNNITTNPCTKQCLHYNRRPVLKIPFLIGGLLLLLGPVTMLIMFFIKRYRFFKDANVEVVLNDEQKERYKKFVPKKTLLVCVALFFAFGIMTEFMYMDFSATFFQFQPVLRLSAEKAAQIFSTMSVPLSVGRGLSVFIAIYLKPQIMISVEIVIVFAGYLFQIFGQNELVLLWASAIVICFGYSSIFICMFSFVGQYMEVTDRIGGLFIGSYNSIYLFLPYFISYYIEVLPSSFLYVEICSLSVGIVFFVIALIAVRNVPKDLIRKIGPVAGH